VVFGIRHLLVQYVVTTGL